MEGPHPTSTHYIYVTMTPATEEVSSVLHPTVEKDGEASAHGSTQSEVTLLQTDGEAWPQEIVMLSGMGEEPTLSFPTTDDVVATWRRLQQHQAVDDSQFAALLLQCFEDMMQQRCTTCQSQLHHFCSTCFSLTANSVTPQEAVQKSAAPTGKDATGIKVRQTCQADFDKGVPDNQTFEVAKKISLNATVTDHVGGEKKMTEQKKEERSSVQDIGLEKAGRLQEAVRRPLWMQADIFNKVEPMQHLAGELENRQLSVEQLQGKVDKPLNRHAVAEQIQDSVSNHVHSHTAVEQMHQTVSTHVDRREVDLKQVEGMLVKVEDFAGQEMDGRLSQLCEAGCGALPGAEAQHLIVSCVWCGLAFGSVKELSVHAREHASLLWQEKHLLSSSSSSGKQTSQEPAETGLRRSSRKVKRKALEFDFDYTPKRRQNEKLDGVTVESRGVPSDVGMEVKVMGQAPEADLKDVKLHAKGKGLFECFPCGLGFGRIIYLTQHLVSEHRMPNPWGCCECKESFAAVTDLAKHVRSQSHDLLGVVRAGGKLSPNANHCKKLVEEKRPYVCAVCCTRFTHLGILSRHGEKHPGASIYRCWPCEQDFKTLADFTGHCCQVRVKAPDGQSTSAASLPVEGESLQTKVAEDESVAVTTLNVAGPVPYNVDPVETSTRQNGQGMEDVMVCAMTGQLQNQRQASHITNLTSRQASGSELAVEPGNKPSEVGTPLSIKEGQGSVADVTMALDEDWKKRDGSDTGAVSKREGARQSDPSWLTDTEASGLRDSNATDKHCRDNTNSLGRSSGKDLPHRCPQCPAAFASSVWLLSHSRKHTGQEPFPCPQCRAAFRTRARLHRHLEAEHWGDNPITCGQCGKVLSSQQCLEDHRNSHTGESPHACPTCGERFRYRSALNRHRRKHKDRFRCSRCEASFHLYGSYKAHLETHAAVKAHLCCICGAAFAQAGKLALHTAKHGPKQFVCEQCGKAFHTKGSHTRHLATHLDLRPFPCNLCPRRFPARNKLELHHRQVHLNLRPYSCRLCPASYATAARLNEHFRASHTSLRPYACPVCSKTFAKSGCRQAHVRTVHKGSKGSTGSSASELGDSAVGSLLNL